MISSSAAGEISTEFAQSINVCFSDIENVTVFLQLSRYEIHASLSLTRL
jgi:hypothetical protein